MAQVTMAQLIRYRAPQYLVEPVGDASDDADLDAINNSIWDEVFSVLGWEPYNEIIRVWGDEGTVSWTYLAMVEGD